MMKLILSAVVFSLTACAHSIHDYHVSDTLPEFSKSKTHEIHTQSEQFVIFWFAKDTQYAEKAYQNLIHQCSGPITNINTRYSTSLGFFSWTNKIFIQAQCLTPKTVSQNYKKINTNRKEIL